MANSRTPGSGVSCVRRVSSVRSPAGEHTAVGAGALPGHRHHHDRHVHAQGAPQRPVHGSTARFCLAGMTVRMRAEWAARWRGWSSVRLRQAASCALVFCLLVRRADERSRLEACSL